MQAAQFGIGQKLVVDGGLARADRVDAAVLDIVVVHRGPVFQAKRLAVVMRAATGLFHQVGFTGFQGVMVHLHQVVAQGVGA